MNDPIITPEHCRKVGYCMKQVRPWLVSHGFDVTTFVREGIAASRLEATGDDLAIRLCDRVRKGDL